MIDLIDIEDISIISDWVELNVIHTSKPLSKAKLISLLGDNGYEKDVDYDEDSLFDSVLQELQRRQTLYGNNPPFSVENNIVIPQNTWNERPEYFMCLLFSYWGAANAGKGTRLFEQVSNLVLKSYLNGKAITLGFPNEGDLPGQLDNIAATLSEDRAPVNPPAASKDRGVDVIGWLECEDSRKGQIIILMQCAAGRNWNLKKRIMLDVWSQYINWNYYTTVPSLSITEVVEDKNWSESVVNYGVVFDRARIFKYLYKPTVTIDPGLRGEIIDWCNNKMN
jgi:hypothetical protein